MTANNANFDPTTEVYQQLQLACDTFNQRLFGGSLSKCLITLQRKANTMGYFSKNRFMKHLNSNMQCHELALNPEFFAVTPIIETLQTIVHELTHQWQAEFGTPSVKSYHNTEWADKMVSVGLMPSDTGRPGGKKTGQQMADYPIEGGLFLQVCAELFDNNYKMTWYDRYLPAKTTQHAMESAQNFVQGLALPEHALQVPWLKLPESAHARPSLAEDGTLTATASETESFLQVRVISKLKYSCLNCKINVWGKPKLKLICGICQGEFKEVAA